MAGIAKSMIADVHVEALRRGAFLRDMRLWWLRCRESQDQFRYYWDAGSKNWADNNTKHHPDTYHEAHRNTHAGIWDQVDTIPQ